MDNLSLLTDLANDYLDYQLKFEDPGKQYYICHKCANKLGSFENKYKEFVKLREELLML